MVVNTLCRLPHGRSARILSSLTLGALILSSNAFGWGTEDQRKQIFDRIAGVPPSESEMTAMDAAGSAAEAAQVALDSPYFYDVTLKNMVTPWTNEEQTVFAPLNDYTATVIGLVRDKADFRSVLYTDQVYVAKSSYRDASNNPLPAYSLANNSHYEEIEDLMDRGNSLFDILTPTTQTLPAGARAGVMSTRAAGRAFFSAGTNRAMLRFTLINHLCMDLEQFKDTSLPADRIRQDVSRSPGGDSSIFLNNCIGCHSGMDPLVQAFAYYDFDYGGDDTNIENGTLVYNSAGTVDPDTVSLLDGSPNLSRVSDPNVLYRVQDKYFINFTNFPYGYVTNSDQWTNYWREGRNSGVEWNAGGESPGASGIGAGSLGRELANSQAFAQCHVKRVFKTVCLRDPDSAADANEITNLTTSFMGSGYHLDEVFASAAAYCVE
ncbi:hypothetical protein BTA51_11055 [Hahella sp. CCB-MM4]|uniref:hypothetical protein n=1 Tax=Hahella sp. (strain CCB-MM4) TaxID=1926491 RepID=UPI000B9C353B|nr:hypothetical protein [Hahella sp. CCB-MM4]OZG73537.1 hypothetical protein BTA51_11055 [Hahella sp. CCB-MM4]